MMEPIQDDPRYAILRERLNKPQRLSATSEEWEALEGLVAERDLAKNSLHNTTGTMEVWKRRCLGAEAERDRLIQALETLDHMATQAWNAPRPGWRVVSAELVRHIAREALTKTTEEARRAT